MRTNKLHQNFIKKIIKAMENDSKLIIMQGRYAGKSWVNKIIKEHFKEEK